MSKKTKKLKIELEKLYKKESKKLLFHGWHHIDFVTNKSLIFAKELGADSTLVEAAALTHDLNYIVRPNSPASAGKGLRAHYLRKAGFVHREIQRIEKIINEEETATRDKNISKEAMAVSDADTLFKALPITPIIFSGHYIIENDVDISRLARKIVIEQEPLMRKNIYFYTKSAKKNYIKWAKSNLELWSNVLEALKDDDVKKLLRVSKDLGVI